MPRASLIRFPLAVFALVVVAAPALAHPPAPVGERGRALRGKVHTWIHQAKVPLVRGRIQIRRRSCPGHPSFEGCVFSARPRTLYLKRDLREPRRMLYHELGHVFDLRVLNRRERGAFKRIMGIRRRGWFRGGLPPAEWFGDGYAACAQRRRLRAGGRASPYGYGPTPRQHARVCRLIATAAAPRGRPPQAPQNPPPVVEAEPPPPDQSRPGQGGTCNLIDQLLTGCTPGSPLAAPLP
jgi:hypothetical protein